MAGQPLRTYPWGFSITLDKIDGEQICRVKFDSRQYDVDGVRDFMASMLSAVDFAAVGFGTSIGSVLEERRTSSDTGSLTWYPYKASSTIRRFAANVVKLRSSTKLWRKRD